MKSAAVVFGISLCMLIGCASLVQEESFIQDGKAGISYFLPKRLHKVSYTIARTVGPDAVDYDQKVSAALKDLNKKAASAEASEAELKAKTVLATQAKAIDDREKSPESAKELKRKITEVEIATSNSKLATDAYSIAQRVFVDLKKPDTGGGGACSVSLQIEPLALVADEMHPRIANVTHLYTRDDHLTVTTTPAGLLSGADAKSVDRTGDILVAIAQAAIGLPGGVLRSMAVLDKAAVPAPAPAPTCDVGKYSQIVDFADTDGSLTHFSNTLAKRASDFSIGGRFKSNNASGSGDVACPKSRKWLPGENKACGGFAYRRELPYSVTLTSASAGTTDVVMITMPQGSPIAYVPHDAGWFVSSTHNVIFDNGMLVKREVDKPSEILALAKLPVEMARGVMTVLTDFIKLRVDYVGQKGGLVQEETDRINALIAYRDAVEKRVEQANTDSTSSE